MVVGDCDCGTWAVAVVAVVVVVAVVAVVVAVTLVVEVVVAVGLALTSDFILIICRDDEIISSSTDIDDPLG